VVEAAACLLLRLLLLLLLDEDEADGCAESASWTDAHSLHQKAASSNEEPSMLPATEDENDDEEDEDEDDEDEEGEDEMRGFAKTAAT